MTTATEVDTNTEQELETTNNDVTAGGADDSATGQDNPLGLSDEEFLKQPIPGSVIEQKPTATDTKPKEGEADEDTETTTGDGAKPEPKVVEGEDKSTEKKTVETNDKKVVEGEKAPTTGAIDYKSEYERIMAPFKANGREIQARSVEDAISLMQMGANYNKRMAGLKPALKVVRLLENNGLMDEEKLSFLIELNAKKPEAINKLLKDSGLNPMDLDLEKAGDYRPTTQRVDDREVELDTVLDDIKESDAYTKTLAIAQGWDADSKKVIGDHPALLKVINDHVERGIYDLISVEVARERTFGRLQGLSDIAAYRQVGDAIQARGGFDHLGSSQGKTNETRKVVEPKPKKDEDESRNDKRRALGTPKPAAPSGQAKEFNPLALSDEEFLKQATPKFR